MPLRALPFLRPSMHAELNNPPIPSFFSPSVPVFHLFRSSSHRPHSAPTCLSGFQCEYEWKSAQSSCDSLFPASDSDHALISVDFIVFSRGGEEKDKVDHTGRTDTGDEAMMGKSRRWNRLGNRTVIDRRMKVSMWARDKGLCRAPPVWTLQVYESHTGKWEGPQAGLTPFQGWGYFHHIYLSRRLSNGRRCAFLDLTLEEMWEKCASSYTHRAPTVPWCHWKQTSRCISFSFGWCMSVAIYGYLAGKLAPTAAD